MDTCVCPSVDVWTETKKHTSYDHLCPSAHVWTVRSYKTPLLWLFLWYSWYFGGYFVFLQPHKTDSHTGKKTPKFMDKSSHKTPFCGSGHTDTATQNPIATQEKGTQIYGQKLPQDTVLWVRPSVRHTFFTMFPSSYHHEIFRSYYHGQKGCPCKRSRSEVKGQGHRGQHPT